MRTVLLSLVLLILTCCNTADSSPSGFGACGSYDPSGLWVGTLRYHGLFYGEVEVEDEREISLPVTRFECAVGLWGQPWAPLNSEEIILSRNYVTPIGSPDSNQGKFIFSAQGTCTLGKECYLYFDKRFELQDGDVITLEEELRFDNFVLTEYN